jgi:hypothetical protein
MAQSSLNQHYLALIDEAYDRKAWHGTTLRGSLRGVTAAQAAWRPGKGRHNIWEIAVHAAYWKYAVARRLTGARRGSFALKGSNWLDAPDPPTETQWREVLTLLGVQHRQLRGIIEGLDPADLSAKPRAFLVRGIAAHDLYHAGQIQLLKRLARDAGL